jgi:catechol 2,3-dioxygenase-like lactoylglutathione lyase family enzyme
MAVILNHTIVPVRDRIASARFFAEVFAVEFSGVAGPFAQVQVNDSLTFDFEDGDTFEPHHYAFHVTDAEFDGILGRVREMGVRHGSGVEEGWNEEVNRHNGGRGLYFPDPSGHVYEILTRP